MALTIEVWTFVANTSFLGITDHYFNKTYTLRARALHVIQVKTNETSENLAKLVRSSSNEWGIFEQVHHIVTDSVAPMISMVSNHLMKKHFPCIAHTLNLMVQKRSLN